MNLTDTDKDIIKNALWYFYKDFELGLNVRYWQSLFDGAGAIDKQDVRILAEKFGVDMKDLEERDRKVKEYASWRNQ